MKVVVVDDEAPARERLKRLLDTLDAADWAGEAADADAALLACDRLRPDVVLLDIRMPGRDGLALAQDLRALPDAPEIIFTTAYAEFAVQAFAAEALHYLLKPVRAAHLAEALQRAVQRRGGLRAGARTHLPVRHRQQLLRVAVTDILYLRARDKYVEVSTAAGTWLSEESLHALEREFGGGFVRIHRGTLVNRHAVRALERDGAGHHRLLVHGAAEPLEVSRRHVGAARALVDAD